jgi:hypothetical protein
MSSRTSGLVLCTALFASWLFSGGTAAAAARPVTVGDFAVRLARALGFTTSTPAEARERLAGIGVGLAGDLESPLTEAGAVGFSRGLGLPAVNSGDPAAVVSGPAADVLVRVASEAILSTPAPPGMKGSIPVVCLNLNRTLCIDCCVASLLGYSAVPARVLGLCTASCSAILSQMGVSPSGP